MGEWTSHERNIVQDVEHSRSRRQRFGIYTGLVEDTADPELLGRARVRVWAIHGPATRTPVDALPWAMISDPKGGSLDSGSFGVPPVGASVYVQFEQGIEDFPIITGTFRGTPVADANNPQTIQSPDGFPYTPTDGQNETPAEVWEDRHKGARNPTVHVPFKTAKGAGIMVDDGDEREKLRMVDRAGQGLEFYAPGSKDANRGSGCNAGNSARRGARTAFRGDQLPQDALKRRSGHVRIKDTAGQEIMLEGKDQAERIRLVSRDARGTTEHAIELRSGKGKEGVTVRDKSGSRLEFDPNGARAVNLQDSSGNRISMIPGGSLELASVTDLRITSAKNRSTHVAGSDTREVLADSDDKILGNLKTQVTGGINVAALGGAQVVVGGQLQVLVTNAPQPGMPPTVPTNMDNAVDVSISIGGFKFKTTLGSVILECGSTPMVDKVLVGSGNPASCTEPVVCGNILVMFLTTLLNALLTHTHASAMGPTMPPDPATIATLSTLVSNLSDPTHANPADPCSTVAFTEKTHIPSM